MTTYSVADAKNQLPKLIDRPLRGEEAVIARRGKPVVELRPAAVSPEPPAGSDDWLSSPQPSPRGRGEREGPARRAGG